MKLRMGLGSMVLAALAVAAPAWARTEAATIDVMQPMTVAGTNVTLQPGHYEFRVFRMRGSFGHARPAYILMSGILRVPSVKG